MILITKAAKAMQSIAIAIVEWISIVITSLSTALFGPKDRAASAD